MNPFWAGGGLSPRASLNRHPLVDLPGMPLEPEFRGRTAYPAISGARLEEIVKGRWSPEEWTPAIQKELDAFGRLFGRLTASLVKPSPELKEQRREWWDAEWSFWGTIGHISLAGGVFEGPAGRAVLQGALGFLADGGFSVPTLEILPQPSLAGMTGAALGTGLTGWIPALDAGQTRVKRGWVLVEEEEGHRTVKQVRQLGDVPAPRDAQAGGGESLHRWLVSLLDLPGRDDLTGAPAAEVTALSLANYLPGGCPEPRGLYGLLGELGPSYPQVLAWDFSRPVQLFHDGTAAAFHLPTGEGRAVIVAGTALGVGFAR